MNVAFRRSGLLRDRAPGRAETPQQRLGATHGLGLALHPYRTPDAADAAPAAFIVEFDDLAAAPAASQPRRQHRLEQAARRRQRAHGAVQHAEQPVTLAASGAVQFSAFGAFVI